jgi:hypothetical protein
MIKLPFAAAALLASLAVTASATPADDIFNAAVFNINESVAKLVAAQARRSQAPKADPKAVTCTPAQIDTAYVELRRCEASMKAAYGQDVRDFKGNLITGFNNRDGLSLVLLTTTDAFFYHEDCDICAAVERCSLKDGVIKTLKAAHSVDCADLAPFLKKDVAFSSCPLPKP